MNSVLKNLEPQDIWRNFSKLNAVPRPSKKEERVIAFIKKFGDNLNLHTTIDKVGNVIVKKPATKGMSNRKGVVLQAHLDMVHQKNAATTFNFLTQGIEMYVEGDWVKAKGTTLGADNGLGVAAIMAVLESSDIAHPPIEALFTIDEETGMTGALGFEAGLVKGDILLNLDTEDDDEIGVGCAGGVDITATKDYVQQRVNNGLAFSVEIKGLQGGHSGMDINKGLGNANKIMNKLLYMAHGNFDLSIAEINGGGLRNAIPRESKALVVLNNPNEQGFFDFLNKTMETIKKAYQFTEPDLVLDVMPAELPLFVMPLNDQISFLQGLDTAHNGVYKMSTAIDDLVETSNNISKVELGGGVIKISCLTRSSVEATKKDMINNLSATFELMGCTIVLSGDYPGWSPDMNSSILALLRRVYVEMFKDSPRVVACHAGLECGILGRNYPEMEMISFGPNIRGAHSPDEKVQISSVQKFWNYLQAILKNIPEKDNLG